MGSWRGVGPGKGGANTAARTGDENGAGIPHHGIYTAEHTLDGGRDYAGMSLGAAPYLSRLRQLGLIMLAARLSPMC